MGRLRTFTLTRVRSLPGPSGVTLFFHTDAIGRRSRSLFFEPHQVPAFEGETAQFECKQVPLVGWRVVRRVIS